jgi:tetratricopeptide (TPR) repeat protein
VTAGLAAVHEQNLVHRDIKPTNIMVRLKEERSVTAKIIDLGLAKTLDGSASEAGISSPGAFAGTPEFASPEQFAGLGVDIRSDLYSLGVTLWEMLIGRAPFRGSSVEVMYQHHAPLPIEQLNGIPQPLVVLLEVLLAKDPVRRFQTPAELLKVMPTVRDAINAGRALTKTIRVFVSSTGDVQKERHVAERVMRSIAAEFNLPVSAAYSIFQRLAEADNGPENGGPKTGPDNHDPLVLCPYFLERQRLKLDAGYQGAIPNTAEFDLVICILWSRLGTVSAPALRMADGSTPGSGTDYEIGSALDHGKNRGVPQLRVYRNCSRPTPPLEPKEEREAFGRQWDALQQFFTDREKNSEANFNGAWNNYQNLEEFEEIFRGHFRDFLGRQVDQDTGQKLLSRKVRRWKSSPFRGLNVFDFEHAPIFHGRTRAIGEVLEALEGQVRAQRPFVLIVGASGSGKSSLVRAGVLRLLTQPGTIEGLRFWRWSVTRPGAGGSGGDCFDALAAALLEPTALPALGDPESRNAVRDLGSELREHSDSAALRVRDALDHAAREWKNRRCHSLEEKERQLWSSGRSDDANMARLQRESFELPKARLALVVDQLEELFTTGFSPEVRQKYISALAGLVRSGRVFVLATLRNDFYASYQEFPDLIELTKPGGKFDLRPPTPAEIGNMIRLPAEAAGLHFEQDRETGQRLDDALRDAASATPESLPLLEHVLSLLYEQQSVRGDDLMRWSDYRELGELKGALAKHAEAVFSTLGPDDQRAFPLVMRYLVTLGQGEEEVPNRRTVPYRDFVATEGIDERAGAKGFVDLFIEKRLLVADTDPQGEVTVSVAHEALLREWVRVKSWLAENREFLRMRDRLDSSLRLWVSRGKQKDDLLGPGLPVAEGERLVKEFQTALSREEIDYIEASSGERKRREQARARQFQVAAAVLFILLCAASIGAYFGFTGRVEAEKQKRNLEAKNRELGSLLEEASWASFNQAERQFHLGQWNEGIALLARAVKFDPKNQIASERFFQQLILDRWKVTTPLATFQHEGEVSSAVFSPDGARIVTVSADRTGRLWDGGSGKLLATFQHESEVMSVLFSPGGMRILTASADRTARLWDGGSGKLLATFQHESEVSSAVFSPDGARILTASADKTGRLWDVGSGKLLATFQHESEVTSDAHEKSRLTQVFGATFQHESEVSSAVFSPDGARILTVSRDQTARLWDATIARSLARLMVESQALRQVGLLSELASGLKISEDGSLTAIPSGRRFELITQVRDSAKDDEPMSRFIRWFCSPIEERTIFPDSKMNNATWLDNQIVSIPSVPESLATNAFEAFPSRPLPELAMAKYAKDSAGADFLRSQALKRLPKDGAICTKAGEMLHDQRRPYRAFEAAAKALAVDATSLPAHRLRVACLTDLNRSEDALQEWQVIVARPDAASDDFGQAGYLSAKVGKSDLCDSIFGQGRGRFPKDPDLYFRQGWAMLNLHRNAEAVAAFETSEQLLASGENPSSYLLAGQAAANWAAGIKDNAVAAYARLITVGQGSINWADSTAVAKANLTNAEKQPLLEALAETLRQQPELASEEIAITSVPTDPPGESLASEPIKGTVSGVNPQDYKVVIYARSGDKWWAQPAAASPQTHIGNDGKWESETHGGTEFAALLVKASFKPEATRGTIPGVGGDVIAVAKKEPEKK